MKKEKKDYQGEDQNQPLEAAANEATAETQQSEANAQATEDSQESPSAEAAATEE